VAFKLRRLALKMAVLRHADLASKALALKVMAEALGEGNTSRFLAVSRSSDCGERVFMTFLKNIMVIPRNAACVSSRSVVQN